MEMQPKINQCVEIKYNVTFETLRSQGMEMHSYVISTNVCNKILCNVGGTKMTLLIIRRLGLIWFIQSRLFYQIIIKEHRGRR